MEIISLDSVEAKNLKKSKKSKTNYRKYLNPLIATSLSGAYRMQISVTPPNSEKRNRAHIVSLTAAQIRFPLSSFALSYRILSNLISFRPLISFPLCTRCLQFFLH